MSDSHTELLHLLESCTIWWGSNRRLTTASILGMDQATAKAWGQVIRNLNLTAMKATANAFEPCG